MFSDELDSFMFQTVGHQGVDYIAEAMGLPIYREPTFGRSKMQEKLYYPTEDDEVEDLFRLLNKVKVSKSFKIIFLFLNVLIISLYMNILHIISAETRKYRRCVQWSCS